MGVILTGIIVGGILSLMVIGIALIYGVTGIPNFDIGVVGGLGTFTAWYFHLRYHWLIAVIIGILLSAVIGFLIQALFLNRVVEEGGDLNRFFIITVSLGILFTGIIRAVFPRPSIGLSLPRLGIYDLIWIRSSGIRIFALVFAVAMLILLYYLKEYTMAGKKIVAMSQNLKLAQVSGINTKLSFCIVSMIGHALGAMAVIIWAAIYSAGLMTGWNLTFTGYIITVVGGIGNIWGGMLAALLMGTVMTISGYYFGGTWQSVVLYAACIIVLVVSPGGILGEEKAI